ncbi:MAG: type II secretion system F family protein [Limisphaerales bacterium]
MNALDLIWLAQQEDPLWFLKPALVLFLWILVGALLLGLCYGIYFLVTLPLRRKERARLFLDLLEMGMRQGQRPENVIVSISQSRERSVGVRFHLLAAHIEDGLRLTQALDKVPRFLPPQVNAMLKVGEETGDLRKVLPACQMVLQDANSQVKSALNYLILIVFVLAPITPYIYFTFEVYVLPKFQEILAGMTEEMTNAPLADFIFAAGSNLAWMQFCLTMVLYIGAAFYIGGPRLSGGFRKVIGNWVDRFHFYLPWRRKRLQRDFANMLALLLESEVPEAKAVELAGKCTNNRVVISQSNQVIAALQQGTKLQDALTLLTNAEGLHWRLKNAFHHGSFVRSLNGWLEHLDAKAFQQEQAAAHLTSTGFVIVNALLIGLIVAGIFQVLVFLVNEAVLW